MGRAIVAMCIDLHPTIKNGYVSLGAGTVLLSRRGDLHDADRLFALLAAAGAPISAAGANYVRHAVARYEADEIPIALVSLAHAGFGSLNGGAPGAWRLFAAECLLDAGARPSDILSAVAEHELSKLVRSKGYDPDQLRVPAGSGHASGQWTSGGADDSSDPGSPARTDAQNESDSATSLPVQIADASSDWAHYLNPIPSTQAAERDGIFNGRAPNLQHDLGVEAARQWLREQGWVVSGSDEVNVSIPGFTGPRRYNLFATSPDSGQTLGVEVKPTQFSTIFLSLSGRKRRCNL